MLTASPSLDGAFVIVLVVAAAVAGWSARYGP